MKKYLPSLLLVILCLIMPYGTIRSGQLWYEPFIFHFSHANIWHLIVNSLYLLRFKPRWSTVLAAYFVASACAEMQFVAVSLPTCGISGMCFAMQARHDVSWRVLNWKLLVMNAVLMFLPMFNWKLHLAAYTISFVLWKLIYLKKSLTSRN